MSISGRKRTGYSEYLKQRLGLETREGFLGKVTFEVNSEG